jgi:hypothetical protein
MSSSVFRITDSKASTNYGNKITENTSLGLEFVSSWAQRIWVKSPGRDSPLGSEGTKRPIPNPITKEGNQNAPPRQTTQAVRLPTRREEY